MSDPQAHWRIFSFRFNHPLCEEQNKNRELSLRLGIVMMPPGFIVEKPSKNNIRDLMSDFVNNLRSEK